MEGWEVIKAAWLWGGGGCLERKKDAVGIDSSAFLGLGICAWKLLAS